MCYYPVMPVHQILAADAAYADMLSAQWYMLQQVLNRCENNFTLKTSNNDKIYLFSVSLKFTFLGGYFFDMFGSMVR